jgi:hypothetical protein
LLSSGRHASRHRHPAPRSQPRTIRTECTQ